MSYVLMFGTIIIGALIFGFGLDFIEQFIPKRIFDTALIIGGWFCLRWALKDLIKEAAMQSISESLVLKDIIKEAVKKAIIESKE